MDDTISRQAAIDAAINAADEWDGGCIPSRQDMIKKAISKLPSTERHGKWEQDRQDKWRCSVCKVGNNYAYSWDTETKDYTKLQDKYCPNCGAKMDEA